MAQQLDLGLGRTDPREATLAELRRLLPGAFVEGELDPERLLALLGVREDPPEAERYRFDWAGRSEAARALRRRATGALVPDRAASRRFDEAGHVVVEGDNLEVLKLLQPAYAGRVGAVVVDPPYNTGRERLYRDDYADGVEAYLDQTGQLDAEGRRRRSDAEEAGRHHSRWLTMMYPRLVLARQLLADHGALLVTIDDHEAPRLRLLLDEVFGEEHFVADVTWQKRYTRSNNTDGFCSVVDHVLVYRRTEAFRPNLLPREGRDRDRDEFANPDDDPRGPWKPTTFLNQVPPERRPNLAYPITNPHTGRVVEPGRKAWRVNRETYERLEAEGRIWWGRDGTREVPQIKTFRSEIRQGLTPTDLWTHDYAGHSNAAQKELQALFGEKVFDTPKPTRLVRRMLEHVTGPDDLVVDFFAGSGTTGQAVAELNADDGGARRYLLVQLPEPMREGPYGDVAELARERLRRVAARLDGRSDGADPVGHGFRAFRLAGARVPEWPDEPPTDPEGLRALLAAQAEGARADASEEALLVEVMLRAGEPLDAAMAQRELAGQRVWSVGDGGLVVGLGEGIDEELVAALAAERPSRVVLRDAAFPDDALRVEAARRLREAGVELRTV